MAPTWIETDSNTNTDISGATAVGVYASTGDKFVMPQLLADQVAGNGDYVYYVTLQVNGAGSAYVIGPKTTHTAAAGETAIGAQGGFIAVRSGDVLTVYIDGLAGDTATPDVLVRWFELDASANVTLWNSEDVADLEAGGRVNASVGAMQDDVIRRDAYDEVGAYPLIDSARQALEYLQAMIEQAGVGDDAYYRYRSNALDTVIGADGNTLETLSDQLDGIGGITAQEVRDAMKLAPTAGDPAAGSVDKHLDDLLEDTSTTLPAALTEIDDYIDTEVAAIKAKTDLISADGSVSVTSAISGTTITILRGDSLVIGIATVGDISTRSKLWFTVKADTEDADTSAIIQIEETDGLVRLNGAAGTAALGDITVTDENAGDITITLDKTATDDLVPRKNMSYDVQVLTAAGTVTTLSSGTLHVTADVTRAVV